MGLDKLYRKWVFGNDNVRRLYTYYKETNPRFHQKMKPLSWGYLLWLNGRHRVFRRPIHLTLPESKFSHQPDISALIKRAQDADVISFDIFDTLVLRRVEHPTHVFDLVALRLGVTDYAIRRHEAEQHARTEVPAQEATIEEIYAAMHDITSAKRTEWMLQEWQAECDMCFGNEFWRPFFEWALAQGKTVVATSDNYWSSEKLRQLLATCGYHDFDAVFVSCEHRASKSTGALQRVVGAHYAGKRVLHIGDNPAADTLPCGVAGWQTALYRNTTREGILYRRFLPGLAGSAYNALINTFAHSGVAVPNAYYEFGYTYGGLLTYGYCQYIQRLCAGNSDAVILFTARDSEAFHTVYNHYFGGCDNAYLYCSRAAALKACLPYGADMFFDIMFTAKTTLANPITIQHALQQAEVCLHEEQLRSVGLCYADCLTPETVAKLKPLFMAQMPQIVAALAPQRQAALQYLADNIGSHKTVYIVDLGWRGTVFSLLRHLLMLLDSTLSTHGIMMGALDGAIPTMLLQSGAMYTYAFSPMQDWDVHLPIESIMVAETLFSSLAPCTKSYGRNDDNKAIPLFEEDECATGEDVYGLMKQGIYDFCGQYHAALQHLGVPLVVAGREAIAPLLFACNQYAYIMSLFGSLPIIDLAAERPMTFAEVARRLGYKKRSEDTNN